MYVWVEISPLCHSLWLSSCVGSKADPGMKCRQQSTGRKTPSGWHKSRSEAPKGSEWYSGEGWRSGVSGNHQLKHKEHNLSQEQLHIIRDIMWVMLWYTTLFFSDGCAALQKHCTAVGLGFSLHRRVSVVNKICRAGCIKVRVHRGNSKKKSSLLLSRLQREWKFIVPSLESLEFLMKYAGRRKKINLA